jgi:hypothetical protein
VTELEETVKSDAVPTGNPGTSDKDDEVEFTHKDHRMTVAGRVMGTLALFFGLALKA